MKEFLNKTVPKTVGALLNASSIISSNYAAAKALSLFATPRKGLVNKYQQNFLNTSKKVKLSYNEYSIMTYHWPGNNETILLSHGWESNASRWKKLIELLKEETTILLLWMHQHMEILIAKLSMQFCIRTH